MNENKNSGNKIYKMIIIILVIIIILLLLLGYIRLFKNKNDTKIPNGNVNVFEIDCDINCDCIDKDSDNNDADNPVSFDNNTIGNLSNSDSSITIPVNKEKEGVNVEDNDITWNKTNKLKIFENSVYDYDEKIAPEVTNTYQFVIENNTKYNIDYTMTFIEVNEDNINMKYRLLKGKDYVVGSDESWMNASELNLNNLKLDASSSDTYYLEWKWFSSDNDTEIGIKGNATYDLEINIKAYANE